MLFSNTNFSFVCRIQQKREKRKFAILVLIISKLTTFIAMKMNLLALFGALASLTSQAKADFHNGAPLLVASPFFKHLESSYILSADNANSQISNLSDNICSKDNLLVVRVHGLTNDDLTGEFLNVFGNELHIMSNNVIYPNSSMDSKFEISPSCGLIDVGSIENDEQWLETITQYPSASSQSMDLNNSENLMDKLEKLSILHSDKHIIIQGVPVPGELIKQKRKAENDVSIETIEKTIREAFEEVEGIIDENQHEPTPLTSTKENFSNEQTVIKGGLFAKYTFFTPGIWMGTLVSVIVFLLTSTALSWLSSMQISYKAFDKPIDFEKKFQ